MADDYDPFAHRGVENSINDWETYMVVVKAVLGTGILGMPVAFMYAGIILGIFATFFTALISTHCSYILVQCAHILYDKTQRSQMTFDEVAEVSFQNGPEWCRGLAPAAKFITIWGIFITYFGTCSCYTVIIASNVQQVLEFYEWDVKLQVIIAALLVPLILICWIPRLKTLSPALTLANLLMFCALGITCYYFFQELPPISDRDYARITTLPEFFAISIFALAAIGVIMPVENAMIKPQNFLGICGIMSLAHTTVAILYTIIGFMGYLRYGSETAESISLNLPVHEVPAQCVKIFSALSVYTTFALQFYVCLEIAWNAMKETWSSTFANYVLRTVLVVSTVGLALLVPTIAPFMGLVGAFGFSILGIIFPALIEIITYWDIGYGPWKLMIWKDAFIIICGIFALVLGTVTALKGIYDEVYS